MLQMLPKEEHSVVFWGVLSALETNNATAVKPEVTEKVEQKSMHFFLFLYISVLSFTLRH